MKKYICFITLLVLNFCFSLYAVTSNEIKYYEFYIYVQSQENQAGNLLDLAKNQSNSVSTLIFYRDKTFKYQNFRPYRFNTETGCVMMRKENLAYLGTWSLDEFGNLLLEYPYKKTTIPRNRIKKDDISKAVFDSKIVTAIFSSDFVEIETANKQVYKFYFTEIPSLDKEQQMRNILNLPPQKRAYRQGAKGVGPS